MKIALFKHAGSTTEFTCVWQDTMMLKDGTLGGYTRLSDWIEVTFPMREADETIPEELAQLDAEAERVRDEAARKLKLIEVAKANLLALCDMRVVA